jgi:hypothetical protein
VGLLRFGHFRPPAARLAGVRDQILYCSNFLQLVFLPVITVGTAIMSRRSENRAASDHKTIRAEFAILKSTHAELGKSLN